MKKIQHVYLFLCHSILGFGSNYMQIKSICKLEIGQIKVILAFKGPAALA